MSLHELIDRITPRPQLDLEIGADVDEALPPSPAALSVALARTFENIDPTVKNPATPEWERSIRVFRLLL